MKDRYVVLMAPEANAWAIYDRDRRFYLPNPEGDEDSIGFRRQSEAQQLCDGLNRDPLGREERLRRQDEHVVATYTLYFKCNAWFAGELDNDGLREAIECWRETGRAEEEWLNIQ